MIRFAAAIVVASALSSTAVVSYCAAQDKGRVTKCANNLSQLWKMQNNYMVQFGGAQKLMPLETGDAFWLKLSQTKPPLIDPTLKEIYQCPVENFEDEGCDYRGPSDNVNRFADGDPVGADVDGNHGEGRGGNVLRKSGDVQAVGAQDALWTLANTRTTGGSKAQYKEAAPETEKQKQACVHIGQLAMGLYLYREFNGDWPGSLNDLVEKPKDAKYWPAGGFLAGGKIPKDPWGRDYSYTLGGDAPGIVSLGADGKEGGAGEDADLGVNDVFQGRERSDDDKKREACEHLIDMLTQAARIYELEMNAYPLSGNATLVKALDSLGAKKQKYFEFRKEDLNDKGEVIDPWGNPLVYRNNYVNWPGNQSDPKAHNKQSFDVYSFGPNGKDEGGKGDDINNWD